MKALITAIAVCIAAPVVAQTCGDRADVVAYLAEEWQESRQSIGLASDGMVVEVFASESGSWTILVIRPDGMTCLAASGEYYEQVSEGLPPQGDDT